MITELDAPSAVYEKFVRAYASYVLFRAKWFSAKFEELKDVTAKTIEKKAVTLIKRTQQCISLGLQCTVAGKDQVNLITGYAIKHVANDLRDLFKYHSSLIAPFMSSDATSLYANPKLTNEEVRQLVANHEEITTEISAFLDKAAKSFAKLRIKIPAELSTDANLSGERIQSRLKELASISGGFIASRSGDLLTMKRKQEVEDDDEELEKLQKEIDEEFEEVNEELEEELEEEEECTDGEDEDEEDDDEEEEEDDEEEDDDEEEEEEDEEEDTESEEDDEDHEEDEEEE